jgi:hypothetical protein
VVDKLDKAVEKLSIEDDEREFIESYKVGTRDDECGVVDRCADYTALHCTSLFACNISLCL